MAKTGLIIVIICFCFFLLVGGGAGLYYGNVACPTFGKSCSPAPSPRTPSGTPGTPSGSPGTPSGSPGTPPVNCQVSGWSDSGSCTATACGTSGTKPQTRTVITPAANGGTACPPLTQNVPCNGPVCVTSCPAGQQLVGQVGLGDFSHAYCQVCPAGTSYPGGQYGTCTDCPIGTYSGVGAGSCTACPPGQTSTARASQCVTPPPPTPQTVSSLSGLSCPIGYTWVTSKLQCCETANPINCGDPTAPHGAYCNDDGIVYASGNMTGDNPSCGMGQHCVWNNCYLFGENING